MTSETITCPQCKASVPSERLTCNNCGYELFKNGIGIRKSTNDTGGEALFGCIGVFVLGAAAAIYMFIGGGNDTPPAPPQNPPAPMVSCDLPQCVDTEKAGLILNAEASLEELVQKQPGDFEYIESLSFRLPEIVKKDEYESTSSFKKRAQKEYNSWKMDKLEPNTRLLLASDAISIDEYNADEGKLRLFESSLPVAKGFSGGSETNDRIYEGDRGDIKLQEDVTKSSGIFFTNIGRAKERKINDICAFDYLGKAGSENVSFKLSPEKARAIRGKLRVYYVISFAMPSYAQGGEWCYTGAESEGTAMLVPGGFYRNQHQSHYINVKLHQMIISDGKNVYWARSFT
jgi:hypothetical protein